MNVILIRHGKTAGNLEKRYIGCRTDEPLCPAGIEEMQQRLRNRIYPAVSRVFISPMRRCAETAALIYPDRSPVAVPDFRECDFGEFEGRNYRELSGDARYQAWIDSGGMLPFPGGESREQFCRRCLAAYRRLLPVFRETDTALIVHGGTIMAIMEAMAKPASGYFDYQTENGGGFVLETDGSFQRLPG